MLDKSQSSFAFVDPESLDNHVYGLPDMEYPGLFKVYGITYE